MKGVQPNNELAWLYGIIPSIASLAWDAFEKQSLTKRRIGYKAWEDAVSIAVRSIEKLFNSIHSFAIPRNKTNLTDK